MNQSQSIEQTAINQISVVDEESDRWNVPLDPLILSKRGAIPSLIAKLSYKNESKALEYLRIWGEKRMPVTTLHETLELELRGEGA